MCFLSIVTKKISDCSDIYRPHKKSKVYDCESHLKGTNTRRSQQKAVRLYISQCIVGAICPSRLPYSTYLYLDFHLFNEKAKKTQQGNPLHLSLSFVLDYWIVHGVVIQFHISQIPILTQNVPHPVSYTLKLI